MKDTKTLQELGIILCGFVTTRDPSDITQAVFSIVHLKYSVEQL